MTRCSLPGRTPVGVQIIRIQASHTASMRTSLSTSQPVTRPDKAACLVDPRMHSKVVYPYNVLPLVVAIAGYPCNHSSVPNGPRSYALFGVLRWPLSRFSSFIGKAARWLGGGVIGL